MLQQKVDNLKGDLSFVQISDSHIGFSKPANPDVTGTLREAIDKINALPTPPAFVLHTGDLTHLSKPEEFDTLAQIAEEREDERGLLCSRRARRAQRRRKAVSANDSAKARKGAGWYSFDKKGVHFIGLVNVLNLKAGGLGKLGAEQLEWIEEGCEASEIQHADRGVRAHSAVVGVSANGDGERMTARRRFRI